MQISWSILILIFLPKIITTSPTMTSPTTISQHPRQLIQHHPKNQTTTFTKKVNEYCYDRVLLLVCYNYCNISLPNDSRREILRQLTHSSQQRSIHFSIHARINVPHLKRANQTINRAIFLNNCTKIINISDAFVLYVVAQKAFTFKLIKDIYTSKVVLLKNLTDWLSNFQRATDSIQKVNASELDEKLENQQHQNGKDEQKLIVLLLYSNQCPFKIERIDSSTFDWFGKFAESLTDYSNRLIFLQMNIDADRQENGWNEIFVEKRFNEIVYLHDRTKCPRLILIQRNRLFLDYHENVEEASNIYDNQTFSPLRKFIRDSLENQYSTSTTKNWIQLGESLTDIEYIFHAQESLAQAKMKNQKFIAIGTTGGIGVIVLAVTIFWGLKSSSYTGEPQTAILALTETNPNLLLQSKTPQRHSSF